MRKCGSGLISPNFNVLQLISSSGSLGAATESAGFSRVFLEDWRRSNGADARHMSENSFLKGGGGWGGARGDLMKTQHDKL
jgi:hypothetical protein